MYLKLQDDQNSTILVEDILYYGIDLDHCTSIRIKWKSDDKISTTEFKYYKSEKQKDDIARLDSFTKPI